MSPTFEGLLVPDSTCDDPGMRVRFIAVAALMAVAGVVVPWFRQRPRTAQFTRPAFWISASLPVDGPAELDPLYVVEHPGGGTSTSPGGAHVVRLEDAGGKTVASYRFSAVYEVHSGDGLMLGYIPYAKASRLEIESNGVVLASASASRHPPTLQITSPLGGTYTDELPVAWRAHDADGDTLVAMVHYSPNGGRTWRQLRTNTTKSSVSISTRRMRGTDDALIRVSVSDGFHSVTQEVGPLDIPRKAPIINISRPAEGQTYSLHDREVRLDASASDPEDGFLDADALTWTFDDGRPLAVGRNVVLATRLGAGRHVITASATDSDGMTGSDQVTITVTP